MTNPQENNWREQFNKKFEVHKWKNDEKERFPCEGGYCDMSPKEIKDFFTSQLSSIIAEVEESYGKEGKFTGGFGFQGIAMGIDSFQRNEDKVRDDIITIIKSRMGK